VHDELAVKLLRERLGGQFGGLAGRKGAELASRVVPHDPVLEAVVRRNMDGGDCQGFSDRP
jgi:hypothetical protein